MGRRRAASQAGARPDDIPYSRANDWQDPNRALDAELFQDPADLVRRQPGEVPSGI
jgi:hypothetical protein